MRKTLALITTALLLGGCTKELELEFDDVDPKVVVMSCVEPDSTVQLRLTYSRFFLSSQPITTIDDAIVQLTVNGTPTDAAVTSSGGDYTVAYRPQVGDRLGLRVRVPGHGEVSATTTVPSAPSVDNVRRTTRGGDDYESVIRFTLNDPAGEDNYYFIRLVVKEYEGYSYRSFGCTDYLLAEGVDVLGLIDGDEPGETYGRVLCFPDDNIAGRSHEIELHANLSSRSEAYLEVTSYSRDRYLYEVTASQYDDDPLESLLSEPVQIHCNIDGGIGIFGARNRILVPIPQMP